ncbi:MAG: hypothetical protein H0W44_01670 [Gammaproteobacteria bacterium]|nr:hypothetical protein [Gammaproteobacteria bacterium]
MKNSFLLKKHYVNLALIIIVLALVAVVWLKPGQPTAAKIFAALTADQVQNIELQVSNKESVQIKKQNGVWQITAPITIPANRFRIEKILSITQANSEKHYAANDLDLTQFELMPPQARLILNEHVIEFGGIAELGQQRYVKIENEILLITDDYFPLISSGLAGLVDSQAIPETQKLLNIQMPKFTISQTTKGAWAISPANQQHTSDSLQAWITQWQQARAVFAERFVNLDTNNAPIVILHFADKSQLQYHLITSNGETALYRADVGIKYHFSYEIFQSIANEPALPAAVNTATP